MLDQSNLPDVVAGQPRLNGWLIENLDFVDRFPPDLDAPGSGLLGLVSSPLKARVNKKIEE
jgi:hypothetical protein